MLLNPRLVTFNESRRFAGISVTTPSSFNDEFEGTETQIQELFDRVRGAIEATGATVPPVLYGVSGPADDVVPPLLINYLAGAELDLGDEDGFETIVVDPGSYFCVTFRGPLTDMDDAIRAIYGHELATSGYAVRDGLHLEVYGERFDAQSPDSEMDVLIPVHPLDA